MGDNDLAPVSNKNTFLAMFKDMRESLADVLPGHMTAKRIAKMALIAMSRQPKLWQCTKVSMARSIMTAAELGLECSGTLGSAYLVPFKNKHTGQMEAQLIPGYRGYIDLARRSAMVRSICAYVVHQNDEFKATYGTEPGIRHVPTIGPDSGPMVAVYAVAHFTEGGLQFEIMSRNQVDAIRARSRASDSGPWVTDYEEMAKKTVVRRLVKYLPLSAEMQKLVELDNRVDGVVTTAQVIDESELEAPESRTTALARKLRPKTTHPNPAEADDGAEAPGLDVDSDVEDMDSEPLGVETEPSAAPETESPEQADAVEFAAISDLPEGSRFSTMAKTARHAIKQTKKGQCFEVGLFAGPIGHTFTGWGSPPDWLREGVDVSVEAKVGRPFRGRPTFAILSWSPLDAG